MFLFLFQKTQSNGQPVNVAPQEVNLAGTGFKLKKDKVMVAIFTHFHRDIKPRW